MPDTLSEEDAKRIKVMFTKLIFCVFCLFFLSTERASCTVPRSHFYFAFVCFAVQSSDLFISRALEGDLVIRDFVAFSAELERVYSAVEIDRRGR